MKCLSIRAPWAWAIIYAGKDVENRSWATKFRGRFLVHASATKDRKAWSAMIIQANRSGGAGRPAWASLTWESLKHGGIIGSVELTDCGTFTSSPWWIGPVGFKLADPRPLPFIPYKARLGFFEVPDSIVGAA